MKYCSAIGISDILWFWNFKRIYLTTTSSFFCFFNCQDRDYIRKHLQYWVSSNRPKKAGKIRGHFCITGINTGYKRSFISYAVSTSNASSLKQHFLCPTDLETATAAMTTKLATKRVSNFTFHPLFYYGCFNVDICNSTNTKYKRPQTVSKVLHYQTIK